MGKQFTHYAKGTLLVLKNLQLLIELLIQYVFSCHQQRYFPLQYSSLSLNLLYLALEDGSPFFRQIFFRRTFHYNNNNSFYRTDLPSLVLKKFQISYYYFGYNNLFQYITPYKRNILNQKLLSNIILNVYTPIISICLPIFQGKSACQSDFTRHYFRSLG